jgi:hypothetical protein
MIPYYGMSWTSCLDQDSLLDGPSSWNLMYTGPWGSLLPDKSALS